MTNVEVRLKCLGFSPYLVKDDGTWYSNFDIGLLGWYLRVTPDSYMFLFHSPIPGSECVVEGSIDDIEEYLSGDDQKPRSNAG